MLIGSSRFANSSVTSFLDSGVPLMDVVEDTFPLYKSIDRTLKHVNREYLGHHPYELIVPC